MALPSEKFLNFIDYIKKKKIFYLMCLPYLTGFILFELYPLINAFILSVHSWSGGIGGAAFTQPKFIGLGNYVRMIDDELFILSLRNTLVSTLTFVFLSTAFSLSIALIINQKIKGVAVFRTVYFIPYTLAAAVVGVVMRIIFNKGGVLNWILQEFGLPTVNWLGPNLALFTIIFVMVWQNFGYFVLIFLAGLQAIPSRLYEAASIDGAGGLSQVKHITLPLVKPILLVVLFLETVSGLKVYDTIFSMTRGGPGFQTLNLPFYIYWKGFESWELGYADSIGIVLFLIAFTMVLLERKIVGATTIEY